MVESNLRKNIIDTLAKEDVHIVWEKVYRTRDNEWFYRRAIAKVTKYLDAPKGLL